MVERGGGTARIRAPGLIGLAAVPTAVIIGLLALVIWVSFRVDTRSGGWTLDHYTNLLGDSFAARAMVNTVGFTLVATVTALVIGIPLAWLVERTDLGHTTFIYTLTTVGAFIPGFLTAMGWLLFLHPRIGMLNRWLMDWVGLEEGPIDIVSLTGMGIVQGFGMAGIVFLFTAGSLRGMDGSLEEAAAMSGASTASILRRVTLPLAWPGILAAITFVVTISISAFDIPLMIGMPNRIYTFSTMLLTLSGSADDGVGQYGTIAAFGSLMVVVAVVLSRWYHRLSDRSRQYAVVTGKAAPRRVVRLGRWRYLAWGALGCYFGLSQLMPLVLMLWTAFQPYFRPISADGLSTLGLDNFDALPWDLVRRGAWNTALIMVLVPLVSIGLSLAMSWVVLRTKSRLRRVVDVVAFLPVAVPPLVFAFAAVVTLLTVDLPFGIQLYGSVSLLVIMYSLVSLGFGTRTTTTALIQIHSDLEEAAEVSGAGHWMTLRRIVLPLLLPSLAYGALWIALLVSRDITLANVLFAGDNMTVSMVVWTLWGSGQLGRAAALTTLMMAAFLPLIFLYLRRAGSRGMP